LPKARKLEKLEKSLALSSKRGEFVKVKKLLKNNPEINPNCQHTKNLIPLHTACFHKRTDVVKLLLKDSRVDVNKTDNNGETPFWIACYNGDIKIVKLLLNDKRVDVNKTNNNGETPFWIACKNGNLNIVKLLMIKEELMSKKQIGETKHLFILHMRKVIPKL